MPRTPKASTTEGNAGMTPRGTRSGTGSNPATPRKTARKTTAKAGKKPAASNRR